MSENKTQIISLVTNKKEYFIQRFIIAFFLISIVFVLFSSFSPSRLFAANDMVSFTIRMIPQNPGEHEKVKIFLNSYAFDMNTVETRVSIDGVLVKKEIGLKEFEMITKGLGQKSAIQISVRQQNGSLVTRDIFITPASVDLIYEMKNPHRPLQYQGKSTILSNSELTIFAFPHLIDAKGKVINKRSLVYSWYKNYDLDPTASGFGKSSYSIKRLDAYPRETTISVDVKTLDGSLVATNSLVFSPQATKIDFYLLDTTLPFSYKNIANPDLYSRSLDTEILSVPYFMDGINDGEFSYQWNIGGIEYTHPDGFNKNKILLINNEDNFSDRIEISLQIKNSFRILQSVNNSFSVFFDRKDNENAKEGVFFSEGKNAQKNSSFFGL